MPRSRRRSPRAPLAALVLGAGLGCGTQDATPQPVGPAPAPQAPAEPAPNEPEPGVEATPSDRPPPLSEEDLALLALDPKDLSPEMRRKQAYARRRQIMQNPDSPTARALQDLAEAHRAGEIDVKKRDGVWFSLPGTKPTHGRPPAGWRPPPEGEAESAGPGPASSGPASPGAASSDPASETAAPQTPPPAATPGSP